MWLWQRHEPDRACDELEQVLVVRHRVAVERGPAEAVQRHRFLLTAGSTRRRDRQLLSV